MSGRFLYKCLNGLFETDSSPTHVMYQMLDEHNFQMPQQTFKESVFRENVCGIFTPGIKISLVKSVHYNKVIDQTT